MNSFIKLVLIVVSLSTLSCNIGSQEEKKLEYLSSMINVIPLPSEVSKANGSFEIDKNTGIISDIKLQNSAFFLKNFIEGGMDFKLSNSKKDKTIIFAINDSIIGEAYRITISEAKLLVESRNDKGAFFAVQTLRQLLPASFENKNYNNETVKFDLLKIEDNPEYSYRGFMLDVARHFFTVDEVKHVIDIIAMYKINTLHLHLTDDQGWRIEIKSWPNLTAHGSKSSVKNEKAGFYTQEEYIEIQNYAKKHHIEVIPEIDMPGHTNAALSSYPELNCNNKATKLYTGTRVGFSTLCTSKEITYKFVDDVIGELASITTGRYIHIGGDESHSTKKVDYIFFIDKARKIVESHGKKLIGWDEIAHSDINDETIVQFWAKEENAKLAVQKGAKVILSPSDKIYLDIKYNDTTKLGLTWAGLNNVRDAYEWRPDTLITSVNRENILGIEAPLWTETVVTLDNLEYLILPRLLGVAELAWSNPEKINWESYKIRLAKQQARFDSLRLNNYKSELIDWE